MTDAKFTVLYVDTPAGWDLTIEREELAKMVKKREFESYKGKVQQLPAADPAALGHQPTFSFYRETNKGPVYSSPSNRFHY